MNSKFSEAALAEIHPHKDYYDATPEELMEWIGNLSNRLRCLETKPPLDYNPTSELSTEDYELLLGVSRDNFDKLIEFTNGLKNSANRSKRKAVAILLIKIFAVEVIRPF